MLSQKISDGGDSPDGSFDETCISESPETKEASRVAKMMDESNKEYAHRSGPGMPSSKKGGVLQPMKKTNAVTFTAEEAKTLSQAIVMQINSLAGQLFELHTNLNKLILFKPRRVYKYLSREYQNSIERSYGENILRHVVMT